VPALGHLNQRSSNGSVNDPPNDLRCYRPACRRRWKNLILPAVQPVDLSLKGQGKRHLTVNRASNTVCGDFSGNYFLRAPEYLATVF
jgi:hypothetical protein